MSGFIDNGLPNIGVFTGLEKANLDLDTTGGAAPTSVYAHLQKLAAGLLMLGQNVDVVGIAGQRFSVSYGFGVTAAQALGAPSPTQTITGIEVLVGTTGGTDLWIVELHDSTGALVATSALAGTTAGTANTWQKIPFTTPYVMVPGTYFLTLQSNGTTAKFRAYNSPGLSLLTQSAAGTFGTSASITPPTTYTALVGPVAILYV